jgi:hypothetical protein
LRLLTALAVRIELAHFGRMRVRFVGRAFAPPAGTELLARIDYYGNVLVWPGRSNYRTLVPGTLRALLEEGRIDVTPLVQPKSTPQAADSFLGQTTERVRLETPTGKLTLQQASNPAAGSGAELLCRVLVELVGAEPDLDACSAESLPVAAEYEWSDGGRLSFEVASVVKRAELDLDTLSTPPAGATFRPGELPPRPNEAIVDAPMLSQLRGHAPRPSSPPPQSATKPPQSATKMLTLVNHTDTGRYFLLEGVPVTWIAARGEASIYGLDPGHYSVSWRDFFATQISAPVVLALPAHVVVGTDPDAGKAAGHAD